MRFHSKPRTLLISVAVLGLAAAAGAIGGFLFAHDSSARATTLVKHEGTIAPAGSGIAGQETIVLRTSDGHTLGFADRADSSACILYDGSAASVCPAAGSTLSGGELVVSGMVRVDPTTGATTMFNAFGYAPGHVAAVELVHRDGTTTRAEFRDGLFYLPAGTLAGAASIRSIDAAGRVVGEKPLSAQAR